MMQEARVWSGYHAVSDKGTLIAMKSSEARQARAEQELALLLLLASGALAQGHTRIHWQPTGEQWLVPGEHDVSAASDRGGPGTVTANQGTAGSRQVRGMFQPGTNAVCDPSDWCGRKSNRDAGPASTTSAYTAGWLICPATVATCNSAIAANPITIGYSAGQ